jgi:CheY-like chemotaxis protein
VRSAIGVPLGESDPSWPRNYLDSMSTASYRRQQVFATGQQTFTGEGRASDPYRFGRRGRPSSSPGKKPDVIVLDMLLPKLGGTQLLKFPEADPLTAKIPVIVLSSLSQKNEEELVAAGATAYLEKSNLALDQRSSELSRTIAKLLTLAPATH